jgi:O-antigen biosynthesis protein
LSAHQPKISVIIVNYNVEFYLEQCLNSVFAALQNISGEVFVVDNNSIDSSVEMVQRKFPLAHLIANKNNVGFSKANNQAMELAKSEYILLLNPDTVVEEDTFVKCAEFMDAHPEAGGLGVRMIDGKGNFLPESKRGLPTPAAAFYKIFGISRLFPKSKTFSKYHLSYLNEFETNEIEVLSGAFMWMRKSTLDNVGLLDETFFMYGEDIDLSYRILLGGYKNYYFPKTQIIHYKGESTKKSSVNYVFVFYRAMIIFAEKHFSQKNAKLFSILINLAIYFRASLAILNRIIKKSIVPLLDISFIITSLWLLTIAWHRSQIDFPPEIIQYALPAYTLIWVISILYSGGYDRPIKLFDYLKGVIIGTIVILAVYALLPKQFQFSRLYILLGGLCVLTYYVFSRIILSSLIGGKFDLNDLKAKRFAIAGSKEEIDRVESILKNSSQKIDAVFRVSPGVEKESQHIGTLSQLDQIAHIHKIDEIIFCAKDTSAESIIHWMSKIQDKDIDFKIAQPDSIYLIGSNSVDTAGDMYVMEINALSLPAQKRNKRTFDILVGVFGFLSAPFLAFFFQNPLKFIKNMLRLIVGKITLVGYIQHEQTSESKLPFIKKGILNPMDSKKIRETTRNSISSQKINLLYAKNYNLNKDIQLLWENFNALDR